MFKKLGQTKINMFSNFIGRGWTTIVSIGVVPIYIKLLGIESYGLIGFFTSLQVLLGLLDLGLGATMNREMARYSLEKNKGENLRDLVRTLELVYWVIGIFICATLLFLSPLIARYWLKSELLPMPIIQNALMIMAVAFSIQWPQSLYSNGLMGLQRQVLWNIINITMTTLKAIGGVLILWVISPTIQALLYWFVFISALQTAFAISAFRRNVRGLGQKSHFRISELKRISLYAANLSAISILIIILGQMDKILLSSILSLSNFAYYVLANTVAIALTNIPAPVTDALFPKYVQLFEQENNAELKNLFHKSCQLITGLVVPLSAVLMLFSQEILFLWTRNHEIALNAHLLTSTLVLGITFNIFISMIDILQIARGWLKPSLYSRLFALILLGPLMVFMANRYGAVGAAIVWLIIYSSYFLITPHFVYRGLLKSEKWRWYFQDIGLPFFAAFLTVLLWRTFFSLPENNLLILFYFGVGWFLSSIITLLTLSHYRNLIFGKLLRITRWPTTEEI